LRKTYSYDLLLSSSSRQTHAIIHDAGMRRSVLRTKVARAIVSHPRRTLVQSPPRCRPELAFSTSTSADADTPLLRREHMPFRFETGIALFAKRAPRPFPPPFLSPPSGSFSDPLSTHHRSRDRRAFVNGQLIRGYTNGDDAVYVSDVFIGANDGVGAWSTRPGGHAGLVLSSQVSYSS
jgi:protein phosphatase PTC7